MIDRGTPARREFIKLLHTGCEGAWDFLSDPLYWIVGGLFVAMVVGGIA